MHDETLRRVALNETLFREINEIIARGQRPAKPDTDVSFRCECARPDCSEPVEVPLGHYEFVREHPDRFILLPDHVTPEAERVVFTTNRYVVVEKKGTAGEVAEATDPRA